MWLFIAFLAIPLIEITLFIQIGGAIGLGWTLATVVAGVASGVAPLSPALLKANHIAPKSTRPAAMI